jgi:hypothetical protein
MSMLFPDRYEDRMDRPISERQDEPHKKSDIKGPQETRKRIQKDSAREAKDKRERKDNIANPKDERNHTK